MKNRRFYSMYEEDNIANIHIYGDIVEWPWMDNEVDSYSLAKDIEELDVAQINVYINSYGGEVAEGLAIYNSLKRHKANVTTYVDGFACSAASIVFSAGDERKMSNVSLLMIHNASVRVQGNSKELRKNAEDLEKMSQAAVNAYMNIVNIEEDEIKEMMDNESWINADEALEMGFITSLVEEPIVNTATQSVKNQVIDKLTYGPVFLKEINIDTKDIAEKISNELMDQLESKPEDKNKLFSFMKRVEER